MALPRFHKYFLVLFFFLIFCLILIKASEDLQGDGFNHGQHDEEQNWINHGGSNLNRRFACKERKISPKTASRLRLKWKFNAGRDITATPAIFQGTLYFPSWDGYLYAVKADDGCLVWKQNLHKLTGLKAPGILNVTTTVARATPTIAEDLLMVGIYGPAYVIAVERASGKLVWSTKLDKHPLAHITMSGTYYKGYYYVGVSSWEETVSADQCCTFRGSFAKICKKTGKVIWQIFTLPDNFGRRGEYAGASIWGSTPPIDVKRNCIYVATGNLYSAPRRVRECQERINNQTVPTNPNECVEPDNHSDSVLAIDLNSGKIRWYNQLGGYDVWIAACILSPTTCAPGPNPDADFGEAPMMLTINYKGVMKEIIAIVQKSGIAWALNRDNGKVIWFTEAGPGGISGGGSWGAATDEKRVYTNIVNSERMNFILRPSTRTTTAGGWVAMDAKTGSTLWSTADPANGIISGPVTVANGVLIGGSTSDKGPVYAINAKTGKILWSHKTGASVYGGASVRNGCFYIGNGYGINLGIVYNFTSGRTLYAFCVK